MTLAPWRKLAVAVALTAAAGSALRAEVVEEIVAKVNDDVITKSDLDSEEDAVLQEMYRRYSGTQLDEQAAKAKKVILRQLIDRKVLIQRASHLFDMNKMQDYFLQSFMDQQNIKNDKELEKLLTQEGMTISDWKKKLVDYFAPQQVLRAEVSDRISISDKEFHDYYDAHLSDFAVPAEATVREIVVTAKTGDLEQARARAEAARARAAAPGGDFAAVAAETSDAGTKSNGGLLGKVKKGDLSEALDQAAFSIPVGEVSPVIEVEHGFHILKVDARNDAGVKSFDDARDDIETKLRGQRFDVESKEYLKKAWSEATIWVAPKYQARLSSAE